MDVLCRLSNNNYYIMLITILPYSAIFALGYNIRRISSKSILAITLVSTFIYISIAIILFYLKGVYMPTGVHKYPPRTYYICYALACIGFLFLNRYRIVSILDSLKVLKLSSFIGSHSFWIYLWHIPFVDSFVNMGLKWYITFPMTLLAAILCTYIQTCIVEVVSKGVTEKKAKFIRLIFEG